MTRYKLNHNQFLIRSVAAIACLAFSGTVTNSALASTGHLDVGFAQHNGGLITAGGDFTEGILTGFQRIYEFDVEREGTGIPFSSGDPGHVALRQVDLDSPGSTTPPIPPNLGNTDGATALPGDSEVSFSFRPFTIDSQTRNVFYWDAVSPFALTPVDSDIELTWTAQLPSTGSTTMTGDSASVLAGFVIDSTDAEGQLHKHVDTELGHATDDDLVPDGIYVVSVDYAVEGVGTADPVYHIYAAIQANDFLDLTDDEDERIEAIEAGVETVEEFIEENLLGSGSGNASGAAPEPSSALLVILAVFGSATFGRSRRRTRS